MYGQQYFTQPDGQGIVFPEEVGPGLADPSVPRPGVVTRTRTPVTRNYRTPLRKIGGASPAWWEDLKAQLKKVPTWAWVTGGAGLVLLLVATKGEKSDWLKKV